MLKYPWVQSSSTKKRSNSKPLGHYAKQKHGLTRSFWSLHKEQTGEPAVSREISEGNPIIVQAIDKGTKEDLRAWGKPNWTLKPSSNSDLPFPLSQPWQVAQHTQLFKPKVQESPLIPLPLPLHSQASVILHSGLSCYFGLSLPSKKVTHADWQRAQLSSPYCHSFNECLSISFDTGVPIERRMTQRENT